MAWAKEGDETLKSQLFPQRRFRNPEISFTKVRVHMGDDRIENIAYISCGQQGVSWLCEPIVRRCNLRFLLSLKKFTHIRSNSSLYWLYFLFIWKSRLGTLTFFSSSNTEHVYIYRHSATQIVLQNSRVNSSPLKNVALGCFKWTSFKKQCTAKRYTWVTSCQEFLWLWLFSPPPAIIDVAPPQVKRGNCFSKALVCLLSHCVLSNTYQLNVVTLYEPRLNFYQVYY